MEEREREEFKAKILARVKPGGPGGECLEWQMCRNRQGYGQVWWGGKTQQAHRLAYEAFVGSVGDLHVLHRCDNPPCCNPDHLFLGTQRDNMADRNAKRRQARGEAQGSAKLTELDVLEIHRRLKLGHKGAHIAADFGVSKTQVSLIKHGRRWAHV